MIIIQLLDNLSYYIKQYSNYNDKTKNDKTECDKTESDKKESDNSSNHSSPSTRININDENIENNRMISEINHQINIAKKNIENDLGMINKYDKEIIVELKSALTETFTNSTYMLQKIIKKNKLFSDDYYDITEQKNNLEQLNNIFDSIQSKYY